MALDDHFSQVERGKKSFKREQRDVSVTLGGFAFGFCFSYRDVESLTVMLEVDNISPSSKETLSV